MLDLFEIFFSGTTSERRYLIFKKMNKRHGDINADNIPLGTEDEVGCDQIKFKVYLKYP